MHHGTAAPRTTIKRNMDLPKRKIIRAPFHDYSGGDYFVTICCYDKRCHFGKIYDNEMHFSTIGRVAQHELETLATHYDYAEVMEFIVMPNHVHAIIRIFTDKSVDLPKIRTVLGVVVGGYKQAVTRFARRNGITFEWQARFNDHFIRGAWDGNRIVEYIHNNVSRWSSDCFYAT